MNKKAFLAASMGAIVQYYDYALFGLMAATISKHFFPDDTNTVQLLKAYVILAIGIAAKPLGAVILGRIGDLYGRSRTLTISLIGTAIPSVVLALTPGFNEIGAVATIILLLYRMTVCMFVSSGTDGIRLFVFEQIGKDRQCLGIALVIMSTQIGVYLASLSVLFFTGSTKPDWFWRGALIVGATLGLLVIIIRHYMKVSTLEEKLEQSQDYKVYQNVKLRDIIKSNSRLFTLGVILAGCIGASYQFNIYFFGTYIFKILQIVDKQMMQLYTSQAIVIYMLSAIASGLMADWLGRKLIAVTGFIGVVIFTLVNAYLISNGMFSQFAFYGNTAALATLLMPSMAIMKQNIPKAIRYRIFSMAHACGSILLSGTTPFIATLLYNQTNITWLPQAYFLILMITLLTAVMLISKMSSTRS